MDACMVDIIGSMAVDLTSGMAGEFFSVRTKINLSGGIEREVSSAERTWLGVRTLSAMDAIFEALLIGKARVAFSELDIGDIGVELFIFADRQTVERVIVAVCCQLFALEKGWLFSNGNQVLLRTIQHWLEIFMILTGEGFRRKNDLMFAIHERLGVVALNDPMRGGHLDRLVIHRVALDLFAIGAALGFAIL